MPLFRRILGLPIDSETQQEAPEQPQVVESSGEPVTNAVLVLVRSPAGFYHNLSDEEFCTWARAWSRSHQLLTYEDREAILDRLRAQNLERGHS